MHLSTNPAVWAQAICILAVYTYLYKDNPVWRFAEAVYLGLGTTYWFIYYWFNYLWPAMTDWIVKQGQWHYVFAIILGLLIFFRYVPSLSWIARYPMSFWVGYGAGLTLAYQPAVWLEQVYSTFIPLNAGDLWGTVNNVLLFLGVLCVLVYFFFIIAKENPVVRGVAEVGKWYIMIALGSAFGNTVLYRWNLFLARANTIVVDWLGVKV